MPPTAASLLMQTLALLDIRFRPSMVCSIFD
jgi:hypothetical protein